MRIAYSRQLITDKPHTSGKKHLSVSLFVCQLLVFCFRSFVVLFCVLCVASTAQRQRERTSPIPKNKNKLLFYLEVKHPPNVELELNFLLHSLSIFYKCDTITNNFCGFRSQPTPPFSSHHIAIGRERNCLLFRCRACIAMIILK